ncbi:MAG: discoidin domain-containing protein [Candidatus Omnitrophica bacterium]|nr:discoidin domain-containing protein [Candidatus Omnitrophota bacterium]
MELFRVALRFARVLAVIFFLSLPVNARAQEISENTLDNFEELIKWEAAEGPGAKLDLSVKKGIKGNCLCLSYDLGSSGSYVVALKEFSLSLPPRYKFSFYVKGVAAESDLEFKLIDKNGNTFWKRWGNFPLSEEWQEVVIRERDITYAWGPGRELGEIKKIEIAVSCRKGGKGKVFIDELNFLGFFDDGADSKITAVASSIADGQYEASNAVDRNLKTRWAGKSSSSQWLALDLGGVKELTGAVLHWVNGGDYDILLSKDAKEWTKVYSGRGAVSGVDDIYFKKTKARFFKISGKKENNEEGYSLSEVAVKGADEEPALRASSLRGRNNACNVLDGSIETKWHSQPRNKEWLEVDFRQAKRFGGLFLEWDKDYAKAYKITASNDGKKWRTIYSQAAAKGGREKIYLKQTSTRFIRILCEKSGTKSGFGIKEIEFKAPEKAAALGRYYEIAAEEAPAGYYPRWFSKQQTYWTYVGVEGDENEALLSEDGIIEPHKRGFTLEPFLYLDNPRTITTTGEVRGKLITREDVKITQFLEKNYLPIPSVKWDYEGVSLKVKLFTYGRAGESVAYARYTLTNSGREFISGKLFLAIRPFQVYTPWQGFRDGGLSPIYSIGYRNYVIDVNKGSKIYPLTKPDKFAALEGSFAIPHGTPGGDIVSYIKDGCLPRKKKTKDDNGDLSAALEYSFNLRPGESVDYFIALPLHSREPSLSARMPEEKIRLEYERMFRERLNFWESRVNRIIIDIPEPAMVNTLKSNIAYSLITQDGAGFQPGSRCYDKPWIRDGGMAATALLKMGLTSEVREFIDWYAGYQYEDGKVPPIIDTKAEDPLWEEKEKGLIEYDSQGEFVYTILQYYYFTKDKEFLKGKLDNVIKALEYLVYLRNQTLTPEFKEGPPEKRKYYGILPPSQSHEGYWREYSYWDDFWGLKGWKDGRTIFSILGRDDLAVWADEEYADFKKCFYDSVRLTMDFFDIDYIPGSASLGDCDPTSTSVAIMYCDELQNLPHPELENTFDRYYCDLSGRFKPGAHYCFTPYELRTAPAFLYMGKKEEALNLLRFMLDCRRPLAWNHLAEVVHSDYRFPTYLGDMPHTWVGAEYINGLRSLFIYEKEDKLILGQGIDDKWLERKRGVSVSGMPTYYGKIDYSLRKEDNFLRIKVWGEAVSPPGGFIFKLSRPGKIKKINLNGNEYRAAGKDEVVFYSLPAEISVEY